MKLPADLKQGSLFHYIFFRLPQKIDPEQAQALTRISIVLITVIGVTSYDILYGIENKLERAGVLAAYVYLIVSALHYALILRFTYTRPWRLFLMTGLDHAMISLGCFLFGTSGAIFYPLYLWVTVGSGLRFGVRYLFSGMFFSVSGFLIASVSSEAWLAQPQMIVGLALGMVILPLFFLALITQLGHTNNELQQKINEAEHLATHDPLTDLPNRVLLEDRLNYSISNEQRFGSQIAVFHIDIDSFRAVNETYGHNYGDELLKQVAERISNCLRSFDTLGRLGGDEFIAIVQGNRLMTHSATLAERMAEYASGHYHHDGLDVFLTIHIGIALYPNDGQDALSLLKNAETAMHRSKEHGGLHYRFYDTHMSHEVTEQLTKQVDMRKALKNREFELYFQPRISTQTGRIVGAEALVRWRHPSLGLLEPHEFIDIAEQTGMVTSLDKWLLDSVCREIAGWQKDGLPAISTSVNVSGLQFMDEDYVELLRIILDATRINPEQLGLEITEGVLIQHTEKAAQIFSQIKSLGIKILLDDFGTRYSSLNYLKRFPVDTLKVDRSFIHGIPDDPDDCSLVRAMITIAHDLRMDVVAEGVETEAQLAWLRKTRCDFVQGFLASRPIPAAEFRKLISEKMATQLVSL